MEKYKRVVVVVGLMILSWVPVTVEGEEYCSTVTSLLAACTQFVTYGSPDPLPGTPCCNAVVALETIAHTSEETRQFVCSCLMGFITGNNVTATPLATLPGFCGVTLGFIIDPTTNCN